MMDVLEKVDKTELIGRDFFVWLWFKSETNAGIIDLGDKGHAEIRFEGKMTLETENDGGVESVTCSGDIPRLKEARFALTENKKVTQATIKQILGDDEYTFTLDSRWMNYRNLKTPKVVQDDKNDPEGRFFEKAGLVEKAVSMMDVIFMQFIGLRLSVEWDNEELPAVTRWIKNGKK
jgi:recombination associated protein RdgC